MPQLKSSPVSTKEAPSHVDTLHSIARKLFWWKSPEEALTDRVRFAAQVMTFGNWDDVQTVKHAFGEDLFREVLTNPPAGIFDARSWVYWHHYFKMGPVPPLPKRKLG